MPPEALLSERDGSISYSSIKGDAYAMGLTLRKTIGFSLREIIKISELQKIKAAVATKNIDVSNADTVEGLEKAISELQLSEDTEIQNQLYIKAVAKTVPQAISLRDISDLMLKQHPGKRFTAQEALSDLPFFDENGTTISDQEFSDHVLRICRFGTLIDDVELHRINNSSDVSTRYLSKLRKNANIALINGRGQVADGPAGSSLSANEAAKVLKTETSAQAQAAMRRLGRSMSAFLGNDNNIADQKLRYKKR